MKKHDIGAWISLLASPVALIVLGLVLLFRPDSASALVAAVLGWCLTAAGICLAVAAFATREGTAPKVLGALACLAVGVWLLKNPLLLAAGIGRLVGILLLIRGIQDLLSSNYGRGKVLSLITALLGLVLILLPMTTSRVVFSLCGLVVLVVGITMLIDRLRLRRLMGGDDDPNIIDAL